MRILKEILTPDYKITIFHWNNRYIIKLEQGFLEQTFKIDQFDLAGEQDLFKIMDETFLKQAADRFAEMGTALRSAIHRLPQ